MRGEVLVNALPTVRVTRAVRAIIARLGIFIVAEVLDTNRLGQRLVKHPGRRGPRGGLRRFISGIGRHLLVVLLFSLRSAQVVLCAAADVAKEVLGDPVVGELVDARSVVGAHHVPRLISALGRSLGILERLRGPEVAARRVIADRSPGGVGGQHRLIDRRGLEIGRIVDFGQVGRRGIEPEAIDGLILDERLVWRIHQMHAGSRSGVHLIVAEIRLLARFGRRSVSVERVSGQWIVSLFVPATTRRGNPLLRRGQIVLITGVAGVDDVVGVNPGVEVVVRTVRELRAILLPLDADVALGNRLARVIGDRLVGLDNLARLADEVGPFVTRLVQVRDAL